MPRYLRRFSSGGNSILSNLAKNYPVSALFIILAEIVGKGLFSCRMETERDKHLLKDSEVIGMQRIWIEVNIGWMNLLQDELLISWYAEDDMQGKI